MEFGFNAHIPKHPHHLQMIKGVGGDWVRLDFNWDLFQRESSWKYDWQWHDDIVEWCKDLELNILGVFGYTPAWARRWDHTDTRTSLPDSNYDYGRFVYRAVRRYRHDVKHWSLWNEPNSQDHMTSKMDKFIDLFGYVSNEIRDIDPDAKIVAPEISTSKENWINWLRLYKIIEDKFDILSVHVYGKDGNTVKQYTEKGRWEWYLRWLRPILDLFYPHKQAVRKAVKMFDKPIWLTETGWATNIMTQAQQMMAYQQFFKYLEDDPLYDVTMFYEIRDDPYSDNKFGVLNSRDKAKMAYVWLLRRGIENVEKESSEDGRVPTITH